MMSSHNRSRSSSQMRWLPNISFSSSSSPHRSLPSPSSSSSVSSPKPSPDQSFPSSPGNRAIKKNSKTSSNFNLNHNHISPNNDHNNNHDMVINNHQTNKVTGSALALRTNSSGGPRLTRGRKLRHLTDEEIVAAKPPPDSDSDLAAPVVPRSPGRSISPTVRSSRPAAAAAVPLPLPLPLRDHPSPGDGEDGLPSSAASNIGSVFGGREARKAAKNLEIGPTRVGRPQFSTVNSYRDKFGINVPTKSAPTSPFASPTVSPQRVSTNNHADLIPFYSQIKGAQVWSAPEMAKLDMQGLPPPAFMDFSAFSTDNSPLHSPQSRSPRHSNFRSPSGPPSPLNAKLSVDPSIARRESNANQEVHPLPLPPGATMLSPPAAVPQVISRSESMPLKSQWQKGKLIGRGTFGSVYVASNRISGALCAMKEVEIFPDDPKSAECIKQLEQEIKVLSQLQHQNIVQYFGSEIVEDRFYIYLEYIHPGSINRYIRDHCGAMTENVVRSFTRHILSGLAYLHSKKTIHRDIKGANLLVDACGVVKLADFGMAKHLSGHSDHLSLKGSPYWMAPELMQAVMQKDNSPDLAFAVDIWSLGCTIIEMFTGKPPWSEYEGAAAMFKVLRDTPPIPESLSPDGKDFLCCCLRRSPAERSTASMLLEHRWLKNLQQLDIPSSSQLINGIKLMDAPHGSPRPSISDVRPDQWPVLPSRSTRGKVNADGSSFTQHPFATVRLASDPPLKLPT